MNLIKIFGNYIGSYFRFQSVSDTVDELNEPLIPIPPDDLEKINRNYKISIENRSQQIDNETIPIRVYVLGKKDDPNVQFEYCPHTGIYRNPNDENDRHDRCELLLDAILNIGSEGIHVSDDSSDSSTNYHSVEESFDGDPIQNQLENISNSIENRKIENFSDQILAYVYSGTPISLMDFNESEKKIVAGIIKNYMITAAEDCNEGNYVEQINLVSNLLMLCQQIGKYPDFNGLKDLRSLTPNAQYCLYFGIMNSRTELRDLLIDLHNAIVPRFDTQKTKFAIQKLSQVNDANQKELVEFCVAYLYEHLIKSDDSDTYTYLKLLKEYDGFKENEKLSVPSFVLYYPFSSEDVRCSVTKRFLYLGFEPLPHEKLLDNTAVEIAHQDVCGDREKLADQKANEQQALELEQFRTENYGNIGGGFCFKNNVFERTDEANRRLTRTRSSLPDKSTALEATLENGEKRCLGAGANNYVEIHKISTGQNTSETVVLKRPYVMRLDRQTPTLMAGKTMEKEMKILKLISKLPPHILGKRYLLQYHSSTVRHSHTTGIYEPIIATEKLTGKTMDAMLGKHPPKTMISIAIKLCQGLNVLSQLGIIHHDLKSDNIFIDTSNVSRLRPVIIDFGTCLDLRGELTDWDAAPDGNIAFNAPEMLGRNEDDPRKNVTRQHLDVCALGTILLQYATGLEDDKIIISEESKKNEGLYNLELQNKLNECSETLKNKYGDQPWIDNFIDVIGKMRAFNPGARPDPFAAMQLFKETLKLLSNL